MNKIKKFFKETRIVSRIITAIWLTVLSIALFGSGLHFQAVAEGLIVSVTFFLLPAIIIEMCVNPVIKEAKAKPPSNKLTAFLRGTKIISRILFGFWTFFGLIGAVSNASDLVYIIPVFTVLFLVPAILIETIKNPLWVEARKIARIKKEAMKEQENRQLNTYEDTTSNEDHEVLPESLVIEEGITEDLLVKKKKKKSKKNKAPLSHRVMGVIFIFFGAFLVLLFIINASVTGETSALGLMVAGVGMCVFGILLLAGMKARAKYADLYEGVYLTEEQIENLELEIELPIVDTPVFLHHGEFAVYYSTAIRQETKNRVVGRTGGYRGGTVRIAKGFSIHTGRSSSTPIYGDVSVQYSGEFVITNERIVFLSDQKGFELNHQNITAATAYQDGFSFQSKNSSYVVLLPRTDLAKLAFDGIRTGEIPVAGMGLSDDWDYDDLDVDENLGSEDIFLIDEMEGHEFEYFCAEILRKNGFSEVSVTKASGDQGVDVLAVKGGIKYAIQCKNYASPLSNTPVQEVNAGKTFYNCHVGVVMTNSTFTTGAKTLAEATGVLLWDRAVLQEMIENAK